MKFTRASGPLWYRWALKNIYFRLILNSISQFNWIIIQFILACTVCTCYCCTSNFSSPPIHNYFRNIPKIWQHWKSICSWSYILILSSNINYHDNRLIIQYSYINEMYMVGSWRPCPKIIGWHILWFVCTSATFFSSLFEYRRYHHNFPPPPLLKHFFPISRGGNSEISQY